MAYPANIAFSFGSQTSGLTSQLDQNFTNLAVGLNGIGNGSSVLSSVAMTTASITTANVTTVSATKINFGDGTTQNTASFLNTWTSYTPVISPVSGNLTTTSSAGLFLTTGKTTFFSVTLTLTNVGNATGILYTLPIAPAGGGTSFLFSGRENGVTGNMWQSIFSPGALTASSVQNYAGTATVANGYVLMFSGVYNSQ